MRFECVSVARTFDVSLYKKFNTQITDLVGTDRDYMNQLHDAFWLQRHIAPHWGIYDIAQTGQFFRISFEDQSGRGRDLFQCRFVSKRAAPVVVYSALSMCLIDLNTYTEEISTLFKINA